MELIAVINIKIGHDLGNVRHMSLLKIVQQKAEYPNVYKWLKDVIIILKNLKALHHFILSCYSFDQIM